MKKIDKSARYSSNWSGNRKKKETIDFGGRTLGQVAKDNLVNNAKSVGTGNIILDYGLGALSTGADLLGNVGLGITGSLEGMDDFRRNRIADLQDLAGYHKAAEKTRRQAERTWGINQELQDAVQGVHEYSVAGNIPTATAQGLGTSILAMGTAGLGQGAAYGLGLRGAASLNAAGSVASLGSMGIGAAGSNETQARQEMIQNMKESGMTTKQINDAARMYGFISGSGEVISEMMFGGLSTASNTLGIGSGLFDSFDDAIAAGLTKNIDNHLVKSLVQAGVKASGEGFEEILSGFFNIAGKKLTYMKDADIMDLIRDEHLLQSWLTGTLSAAISQAPNFTRNISNAKQGIVKDYVTNLSENEQKVVDKVAESRITEDMTNKERAKVRTEVKEQLQEGRLSTSEINKALGNEVIQGVQSDTYLHNIVQNENTQFELDDSETKKVKSEKQQNLYKDMQGVNNSAIVHDTFNVVNAIQGLNDSVQYHLTTTEGLFQKGMVDKNAKGEYTLNGKKYIPRGITVDGNNIYVNLDVGTKSSTQAMYHEMLEAFKSVSPDEYNQFKQMIKDIVGADTIQNEVDNYQKMYSVEENLKQDSSQALTDSVEDEIINDKFGELAESEDFLNRLTDNRTMYQKFVDTIKKFIKYLTGTQEEKNLIKLKDNLEKTFKEKYKSTEFKSTKGETAYSLTSNPKIYNEVQKYNSMEDFIFESNISYDELEAAGLGGMGEIVEYYNNKNQPILKDYDNTKESATFTEDRLDSIISESISEYDDNYARAYITHMSPEQFLGLTASEETMQRLNQETEELDVEKLAKERQHIFLDVNFETGKVTGHEGRHRMLALQRAGIKDVEMVIYPDSGTYDRSNAPRLNSMNLIGQDFRIGKGTDTQIGELIPVSKANVEELRNNLKTDSKVRYSLTDSQGRELSPQQQEYFKDSKVRDNEGRLLEVYHGTPSQDNFTVFDTNRAGQNTSSGEYGLYFTDSKKFADDFSYERLESGSMFYDIKGEKGNVYTNYLNMTTPLDFSKLTREEISNLYDYASNIGQIDGKEKFIENMLDWQEIGNHQLMKGNIDLKAIADNSNYDGIIAKLNVQGNENEYIVFNSNQIKNIDNTNPTSNPDIRYSLTVQEANTGTDNTGKQLTKEQQEYFKDSKATDENGNLIEAYHTTTNYTHQFNEFNPKGDNFYKYGDTVVNFYTDSKEMSSSYGHNIISPNTQRIESMDDVNRVLGDRYRVEENNGKYELYDSYDDIQINSYKELIKIFNQEEQDILNRTFNKSRSEVREMLELESRNKMIAADKFDFYDKTRQKFLGVLSQFNAAQGLKLGYTNKTIDELLDNYLNNGTIKPQKTFDNEQDLFRNVTESVSPYEHYQYSGYLNIKNPYVIDANGEYWNRINVEDLQRMKQAISDKWDIPERQLDRLEGNTLKELNKDLTKIGFQLKTDEYGDLGLYTKEGQLAIDMINVNDVMQEIRGDLASDLNTPISTNDIVFQALAENEAGANYDGVIIKNVIDYGDHLEGEEVPNDVYVTFASNQFKATDNITPTSDDDIRYSLTSNENINPQDVAPTRTATFGSQEAVQEAIAPLREQIERLTEVVDKLAPITEEEAANLPINENIEAPIRDNLTPEESRELDDLETLPFELPESDQARLEELRAKEQNNPETELSPVRDLNDIRDYEEVGRDRSINAYQYEHPEVKPFFQEEARRMLADLDNSTSGERLAIPTNERGKGSSNWEWTGIKRQTSPEIAELLDGDRGYAYTKDDIRKGLNAIIDDKGAENIAVAKRIEFYLDERLRNGYEAWGVYDENGQPYYVEPNQGYLDMLREQEWSDYYESVPMNQVAPEEIAQTIEQDNDLSDFTEEDINLEPFMDYIDQSSENAQQREAKRNEVNTKKEMYINKPSNFRSGINLLKTAFINEYAAIDRYAKQSGNMSIKHKADTYNNYQAIAQSNIEHAQTDINGEAIGRSLNSIFQEANELGLREALDDYLIHYSNLDRAYQGKEGDFTLEQSKELIKKYEAKYPELKPLAKDVWQYSRNARHNLRDAGVISDDVSRMLGRMYPHYVPFVSENVEKYYVDSKEIKPKSTIKRARGGANLGTLLPVEEALTSYTYSQFKTTSGNDLMREIVKTANNPVELGADTRTSYVNADNLYRDENGFYLTAYDNGDQITTKITEDMYNALSNQMKNSVKNMEQKLSFVTKPLQKLSRIRRDILTKWSPTFPVTNAMKDIQDAAFNSKYTKDFLKNSPTALYELATNKGKAAQFKALYGSGTAMGQYDVDSGLYNSQKGIKNLNFLKGVSNINELVELAPRYAEFKASLDNGCSLQEAMYNAREVTTNFSRGGVITKALNRNGFTFLNASVQGFDKFIRNFSGENGAKGFINSLAKATALGILPAVFNELAFGWGDDKDEDYDALPDYIKDNYYLFKTSNGKFIRIPKGRMLSVFGSAARRTLEMSQGEEDAFKGFLGNVNNQIGINNPEENNIFAPFIQAFGSKNGENWYGGDLVPTRLQNVPAAEQYDASIDNFSIWLGDKIGVSPYKINYVLDQYSGGVGDLVLPLMTDEAQSDGSILAPIVDKFVVDSTTDNKYVSDFYTKNDELKVKSNSKYATDEDILRNQYMYNISSQMAELYKERREVQADNSLTKAEKYEKAQAIKDEINALAKEGLDNYEDIKVTGNYATAGGIEYYKNSNNQWKAVSDKDSDAINELGLTGSERSEYFKVKNEISSDKNLYDGSKEKPQVIKDIMAADLTDDAKASLYNNYYKDDLISPMVSLGMDANKYLSYKSQNFTADKDKNGKSISGSKKTKIFEYVNSMDIPYEQKLILVKAEYPTYNEHNYEILNYINSSKMSYDEKMNLIEKLGFKVNGNNVSW